MKNPPLHFNMPAAHVPTAENASENTQVAEPPNRGHPEQPRALPGAEELGERLCLCGVGVRKKSRETENTGCISGGLVLSGSPKDVRLYLYKALKPSPAAAIQLWEGKGTGRAGRASRRPQAGGAPVDFEHRQRSGERERKRTPPFPPGSAPFTQKERPPPPLPSAFHPGRGARAESATAKSHRVRVAQNLALQEALPLPRPQIQGRSIALPASVAPGQGAADSPRTALPSSSSRPRLLGPPPPALQPQSF